MSKINELIQTLCPDGVEYKILPMISVNCDRQRKAITSGKRIAGSTPYYGASGIVDYVEGYIFDGVYLLVSEDGANLLARSTPIAFSISGKTWVNNHAHVLKFENDVTRKFVEYFLNSIDLSPYITGGAQPKLNQNNLNSIEIPVPPLPVQEEIVRILDEYTELETELEAKLSEEIELKQKQYMFLTSELIDKLESDSVMPLESVCGIYDGTHSTPQYTDSGVRFVSVENINDLYGSQKFISEEAYEKFKIKPQIGDVFMTRIGTMGKCAIVDRDEPLGYYVSLALLRPDSTVLSSEYLRWYLESGAGWKELEARTLWNATPIKINKGEIGKMLIKVPSLAVQDVVVKKIKAYYDAKTSLLTSLNTELESRKKQYAYYRDQLLTFKRKE
ncbi:Type I restriction enzyme specificity protein MPN_089 [Anaerostipes hadrus]|uniref:Type I restriction enzyme specificity protein MPN_089 n=1 Tax=Anaerostipes hadrus TaxID=649756 RepID=A0A174JFV4_ANAHA|nr:restriction endonuclease subunit S [Anaerostipes hadrus]CUO96787.1 Type I restriction enzyme specificity protein MPN_089 [Anaerostipes hadrus]